MKNKIWFAIGAVMALVMVLACLSAWFFSEKDSGYYYVQIDNSKIEEIHSRGGVIDLNGGMDYSYTLPAYDENGQGTYITFGASRELREGAYLTSGLQWRCTRSILKVDGETDSGRCRVERGGV